MAGTEEGRLGAVACLAVTLVLGLAVVLLAGAEEGCAGDIAAVACLAVALGAHSLPWARPPQGGGISTHTSANSSHECRAIVTA